ncbi:unnamed protein product, partial [Choristocarpus tenellus]
TGGSRWINSAANAYMVMYRKVDPLKNQRHVTLEDVPSHVREQAMAENEKLRERSRAATARADALASRLTLKFRLEDGREDSILTNKHKPLSVVVDQVAEKFGLQATANFPLATEHSGDVESGEGDTDRETQDGSRSDDWSVEPAATLVPTGATTVVTESKASAKCGRAPFGGGVVNTGAEVGVEIGTSAVPPLVSASPPMRLIRLRDYKTSQKLPWEPYSDESRTPSELNICMGKILWVETRLPGEEWPTFSAKDSVVTVVRF